MEINYIKEFVVLADIGNYLEASEILFISQPSLSKHIKAMETELGVPLFHRTTRKIQLTNFGKTFLGYARQIVHLQHQYATALINQSQQKQLSLNIASIPIMAPYKITDEIVKFNTENKNFRINLIEGESSRLKDLLREGKCELAFIREYKDTDDAFVRIPCDTDVLAAILPAGHPLAKESEINLEQVREEQFLLLQPESVLYRLCEDACLAAGFQPMIAYTGQHSANIIDLVEKGMGISLLMKKPIAYLSNPKIAVVDIKPTITTQIKLYYRKDVVLSAAARHFIDAIHLSIG